MKKQPTLLQWGAFTTLLLLTLFLFASTCSAKGAGGGFSGGSSRSYSAPSSSRSYSSPSFSRSAPSSVPSRSYSTPPSTRTYTPSSSGPRSITPSSPTTIRSFGSSSSRTYYTPPKPTGPPVNYGGRSYTPIPYYRPPLFISHGYYGSYGGGGMPWYAWFLLFNQHQQSYAVPMQGGGQPIYYQQGQTSYNWAGFAIWLVLIGFAWWLVWRLFFRVQPDHHVVYHY